MNKTKKTSLLIALSLVMLSALVFSLTACNLSKPTPPVTLPSTSEPSDLPSSASIGNVATNTSKRIQINGSNTGKATFTTTGEGYYLVYVTSDNTPAVNQQNTSKNNFTYSLYKTNSDKNLVSKNSTKAACYTPKDTSKAFAGKTRCWIFYLDAQTQHKVVVKNNTTSKEKFTVKIEKIKLEKINSGNIEKINIEFTGENDQISKTYNLKAGKTYHVIAQDSSRRSIYYDTKFGVHYIYADPNGTRCAFTKINNCEAVGSLKYLNSRTEEKSCISNELSAFLSTRRGQTEDGSVSGQAIFENQTELRIIPFADTKVTITFGQWQDSKKMSGNNRLTWTKTNGPDPSYNDATTVDYAIYLPSSSVKVLYKMFTKGNLIQRITASKNLMEQSLSALKSRLVDDFCSSLGAFAKNTDYYENSKTFITGVIGEALNTVLKSLINATYVVNMMNKIQTGTKNAYNKGTGLQLSFYHSSNYVGVKGNYIKSDDSIVFGPYSHIGKWSNKTGTSRNF